MGGDTDTIAAMTGALAGARYGLGNIPRQWRQMEAGDILLSLADAFYDRFRHRSDQTR